MNEFDISKTNQNTDLNSLGTDQVAVPQRKRSKLVSFFVYLLLFSFCTSFFFFAGASFGTIYGVTLFSRANSFLETIGIGPILNLSSDQYLPDNDSSFLQSETSAAPEYVPPESYEDTLINAVKKASPAVVSIIVSKDLPVFEQYYVNPFEGFPDFVVPQYRQKGTEKKEIGGGTGFIVSANGTIVTNRHVVLDKDAEYAVFTNEGEKFSAKVLARDPLQDLAILKIDPLAGKTFPVLTLGDSTKLQIGQTVIAIGNALGEFRNTVSVGVISGLERRVTAGGSGETEEIEDVIQTDAAINPGNSGGPLLNLRGEVIGINTAMASGAENIGFAIPINKAKKDIQNINDFGKIVYPFLGVRYVLINDAIKEENNLSVNYGAWIIAGEQGEAAITPGSAAEIAGLKENDIILEFNKEKITIDNSLGKIIQNYNPGDRVVFKILRGKDEQTISVTLGERSE
ncbi:MAG: trypsin-like peptidase domain-containing protein [bacterium]